MATVTSAGVGSGLNLEGIIKATLNAEDLPKKKEFAQRQGDLSLALSGIGSIKSALSSFDTQVLKLSDIKNFNQRTATVTQPTSGDIISVATSSTSTSGNYAVEVVQMAQGSRAVQADASAYSATTDVVTASGGTLTFAAGSKNFNVTLAAGATLADLRTAINSEASNFGVTANIVNTGGTTPLSKLVLTSNATGSGNNLVVTNNIAELDKVSTVANAGGAGGLVIAATDQAQDGIINVDGISISSSTNTYTNSIQDLTITALKKSVSNETAAVSVDTDKAGVSSTIDAFISSFNNVIDTINSNTAVGGALANDSSMRALKNQMINKLSTKISGAGNFQTLFDVGIGLNKSGHLEKSSLVRSVNDALTSNYNDVGTIFASANGVGKNFSGLLDNYISSTGALQFRQDDVNAQLKQLNTDELNHQYRMTQLESTLRKKYTALDTLVASLRSSGDYLTAQLASLPGFK